MLLDRLKHILRAKPKPVLADRDSSLDEELAFWRKWFETKGLEWPADYQRRFDPELQLQPELAQFLPRFDKPTVDILDVGAGPVTRLGKRSPLKAIRLVASDFLAPQYNKLIDEMKVEPLLRSVFADGERLVEQFGEASFDVVHAQNTIDHMERPILAVEQMLRVARPGGVVYLRHEENEGARTGYKTLHTWDFYLDDATGHFRARHAAGEVADLTERFAGYGKSTTTREDKRVVFVVERAATAV